MNTLKFYPRKLREQYLKNIRNAGIEIQTTKYHNSIFVTSIILSIVISTGLYFFNVGVYFAPIIFLLFLAFFYFKISLQASARIKKMEDVFPEVISLMSSNLRSGITIDKAFFLSARAEFHPLDKEILKTGKDITTGQEIVYALKLMAERIESEKISKVVTLIISGLKAGGNIADLLEQTSRNMKEKDLLEKKSRSTILMYVIFIFFAAGVGAPVLFGLGSVLVEIIIQLTSRLPETGAIQTGLPFTFSQVNISPTFITYFSIFFMIISDLVSSLVIGLVRKGDSKYGLRYFLPLVAGSLAIFFIIKTFLAQTLISSIKAF